MEWDTKCPNTTTVLSLSLFSLSKQVPDSNIQRKRGGGGGEKNQKQKVPDSIKYYAC